MRGRRAGVRCRSGGRKRPRQRARPGRRGADVSTRIAARAGATGLALAGLAHDIRTPLTGMLALSDLLLASDLPERERGWAAAMKDAAGHLARLTTLVVDAAKAGTASCPATGAVRAARFR